MIVEHGSNFSSWEIIRIRFCVLRMTQCLRKLSVVESEANLYCLGLRIAFDSRGHTFLVNIDMTVEVRGQSYCWESYFLKGV